MHKMIPYENVKAKLLKDDKLKAEYEELESEFELISQMIQARKEAKLTQAQIAEKMGVSQNQIARIESKNINVKYQSIVKYLAICGKKIAIVWSKSANRYFGFALSNDNPRRPCERVKRARQSTQSSFWAFARKRRIHTIANPSFWGLARRIHEFIDCHAT